MKRFLRTKQLSASQIILLSFFLLIMLGSVLLMLPVSSRTGTKTAFSDALFTATSAVCVTGLVVKDTALYWSPFGQSVILSLIQIGGMGVITVVLAIGMLSGKKIGLMSRQTMQEAISAPQLGGILRLTGFAIKTAIAIEAIGAACLLPGFAREFGAVKGSWLALFHSVSAFCNAGFDLMGGKQPFSSLTSYQTNAVVNLTIMALIIIGGIGFLTWDDIRKNRHRFGHYRMQSKVILVTSMILILLPAVYFFFFEFQNAGLQERIWSSLFQSVTTRTAGFNTADLNGMHDAGKLLMIALMLVGGSPGSTAGGMKTTTLAVMVFCAYAVFRKNESVHCFKRRIAEETIRTAAAIVLMYLLLAILSAGTISYIEGIPILDALFETASAIGTVGLTLGVTTQLGTVSRMLLILLMFYGRVGGLTMIFAALSDTRHMARHYPQEKITVG